MGAGAFSLIFAVGLLAWAVGLACGLLLSGMACACGGGPGPLAVAVALACGVCVSGMACGCGVVVMSCGCGRCPGPLAHGRKATPHTCRRSATPAAPADRAAAQLAPCRLPAVFSFRRPQPGPRLYSCPAGPPDRLEGFYAPGLVS